MANQEAFEKALEKIALAQREWWQRFWYHWLKEPEEPKDG